MSLLARKAIENCRFPSIKGAQCRVLPYTLKQAKIQSRSDASSSPSSAVSDGYVFVKGFLKAHWLHSDLYKAFEGYGKIVSAKVSLDRTHNSRGYGFVQFDTAEQAAKAIQEVITLIIIF